MEYTDLELYIQIRDGQPHEHPIFAENFKLAFPLVDVNSLPADRFAKFIRVAAPETGPYEIYEGSSYEWVGDVVKDVHKVRPMTAEERAAKTEEMKADAENIKLERIAFINNMLTTETSDQAQTLWLNCLTAHEAWVLEDVHPIKPAFPVFPIKDLDGNWVAP